MQAFSAWSPPGGTLGRLVAEARERAAALRHRAAALEEAAHRAARPPSFVEALRRGDVAIIAEVKRRSPSRGEINPGLDATNQARAYAAGGAAAISVLTEPTAFGGSTADLEAVRAAVSIPVLRKDFHVDTAQLLEARAVGAAAALLIVRALSPDELPRLVVAANAIGLEPLVEVRDEWELERAITAGARVVGVNNRDLETLEIDPGVGARLVPRVPPSIVAVWESGVSSAADIARAAACGADAVLVGSALSAAEDAADAVRALTGAAKVPRGR